MLWVELAKFGKRPLRSSPDAYGYRPPSTRVAERLFLPERVQYQAGYPDGVDTGRLWTARVGAHSDKTHRDASARSVTFHKLVMARGARDEIDRLGRGLARR